MWPTRRRLFPSASDPVGTTLVNVLLARRRLAVITVVGASMAPSYRSGDRVLVRRLGPRGGGGIERGGVVVAAWRPPSGRPPGEPVVTGGGPRRRAGERPGARHWMIKRVVAGPGDPVPAGLGPALIADAGKPVPRERFVVLGDNAAHSHDSRHIGYLERGDIIGVVVRRLAPHR
ncbi:S26 family signal peptidase [Streptomyces sp. NPDC127106]|uniref:S26 family signal peptidase n=1 Tax=Streptomyces sp. NPDC127106 TaxID=3345360 RepID=UPI00362929BE